MPIFLPAAILATMPGATAGHPGVDGVALQVGCRSGRSTPAQVDGSAGIEYN